MPTIDEAQPGATNRPPATAQGGGAGLILDVGANEGEFAIALARSNPALTVLAFEPIPGLADALAARARSLGLANLSCRQVAIDEVAREAVFHVADHNDRGVSSLLAFDTDAIGRDEYWRQRADLFFSHDLTVQVRRLDAILAEIPEAPIRFVKVDTQGVDLGVLRSLGSMLGRVEAGMVEAPATRLTRLYDGEETDVLAALSFLRENGFEVHALKPNDPASNEFNILFHRRGLDWRGLEEEIGLRGLPLYDGKHFWHLPAGRLLHPEAEIAAGRETATALAASHDHAASLRSEADRLRAESGRLRDEVRRGEVAEQEALRRSEGAQVEALRIVEAVQSALGAELAALRRQAEAAGEGERAMRRAEADARARLETARGDTLRVMEAYAAAYGAQAAERAEAARIRGVCDALLARCAGLQAEAEALRRPAGEAPEIAARRDVLAAEQDAAAAALRQTLADALADAAAAAGSARLAETTARARHDLAVSELRRSLADAGTEGASARASLLVAEAENRELGERLAALYRSTSWRLAGPLRRVTRLLRG